MIILTHACCVVSYSLVIVLLTAYNNVLIIAEKVCYEVILIEVCTSVLGKIMLLTFLFLVWYFLLNNYTFKQLFLYYDVTIAGIFLLFVYYAPTTLEKLKGHIA